MSYLKKFLNSNYEELIEQSIWAIANIVGDGKDVVKEYMTGEIFDRVYQFFISTNKKANSMLLINNVCKHKLDESLKPTAKKLAKFLSQFESSISLIGPDSYEILLDICQTFCYLIEFNEDILEYIFENNLFENIFKTVR